MFKKITRKSFAKLAASTLAINTLLLLFGLQTTQAAEADLEIGANELGVQMQVITVDPDDPAVFGGNTNQLQPANQEGYYVTGNLENISTQPYIVSFTALEGFDVTMIANGVALNENQVGLQGGEWFVSLQAQNPGEKMTLLANYQQKQGTEATINVAVTGNGISPVEIMLSGDQNQSTIVAEGDDFNFVVPATGVEDYTITCQENIAGFNLLNNPHPQNINNLSANTTINVKCEYEAVGPAQANINVSIVGPNSLNGATVDITPNVTNNFFISTGDNQDFPVDAGVDYVVQCNNVPSYSVVGNSQIVVENIGAGDEFNAVCQYTEDSIPKNITIRVNVNDPDNDFQGSFVDINNGVVNDDFIGDNDSEDYLVNGDNDQVYTVECREEVSWSGEDYQLTSSNSVQVDTGDYQDGAIVEVDCNYENSTDPEEGTIRVHVNGPGNFNGANIDIDPNVTSNNFIADGNNKAFDVEANGVLDYDVECKNVSGYDVQGGNVKEVNNIDEGETVNVFCNYVAEDEEDATIRVRVTGLNNNMEANVNIPGEFNGDVEEGDFVDIEVEGGNQEYDVYCENNINGFDLESDRPIELDDVDEGDFIVVTCEYDRENDDEATIRVRVDGLDDGMEAEVDIPGEVSNFDIETGDFRNFDVEANVDHRVFCENDIDGFELLSDYPIDIDEDDLDEGDLVEVTCEYDEDGNGDQENLYVSVDGPSSLDEARVYIANEFNDDVENGQTRNVRVEGGTDHNVFCEVIPGYNLLSPRPIQVRNINSTRSVTCEYEDANVTTGFRIEVDPVEQYSYNGREVSVVVRAINGTGSSATDVELTFNYDESKLSVRNADGASVNNGGYLRWELGTMTRGEVETRTVTFLVTGNEGETAQNFASALYNQGTVDDVDSFVHILDGTPAPPRPPYIPRTGTGVLSFLLAGLASLSYVLVRKRHEIIRRLKAIRQA